MTAPFVADVEPAERRRAAGTATLRRMRGRGVGVVAERDLPARRFVATYPGQRYSNEEYELRRARGETDGTYAIEFWRPGRRGVPDNAYVLDPGARPARDGRGPQVLPRFAAALAPRVNEPGLGGRPNLMWVWNLPRYRLELWTARRAAAGEELTACYGTSGGYQRGYDTVCAAPPPGTEPELHVVTERGGAPVPWSDLGEAGVARAVRRLGVTGGEGPRTAGTGPASTCTSGRRTGRTGRSRCTPRT